MHYDDVATGMQEDPSPGYPLVCVTPCDPKYPEYVDTQSLCEEAAINASAIKFRWEVGDLHVIKCLLLPDPGCKIVPIFLPMFPQRSNNLFLPRTRQKGTIFII